MSNTGSEDQAVYTIGWQGYRWLPGRIVAKRPIGASAPLNDLQKKFGFTAGNIVAAAERQNSNAKK